MSLCLCWLQASKAGLANPLQYFASYLATFIGNKGFVETVKSALGFRANGRKTKEAGVGFELREPPAPYGALFGGKNEDIGADNTYYWDINL